VLDLAVNSNSERGLLSMVLHPNFPATPFAYVRWTESSTGADSTVALEVPLLGKVPLDPLLRESADAGTPVFEAAPESEAAAAIFAVAEQLAAHRPGGIRTALTVLS